MSEAVNCSTDEPDEFVPLQPVQLVSIEAVPGPIENVPFEGLAATLPAEHPASNNTAGITTVASARPARFQ
jgi:hypothetical protein